MSRLKEKSSRILSKSKLLSYRQCPKRLWLEIHHLEYLEESNQTIASYEVGHQLNAIAQKLYDPKGKGKLFDPAVQGYDRVCELTQECLKSNQPIFEAGFVSQGTRAYTDILLPLTKNRKRAWRMVEVKSSTSIKDYHRDDVAIQAFVARSSGLPLTAVALAHIDSDWVYPGNEDYQGLLLENDLTAEAFGREQEVLVWLTDAQQIANKNKEPKISTGKHCEDPYECGFLQYCRSREPQAKYPVQWLPRIQSKALKGLIESQGVTDLREVPDDLLNERQLRVKKHTLTGKVYFDQSRSIAELADHKLPAYFLDFETANFAIPIWKGLRPFQQIPFQFSLHRLNRSGKLDQKEYIDLTGNDPSKGFAEALIQACGEHGPVFVYNAGFETTRIKELGDRIPRLKPNLLAINERIVDLLKVAEQCYYHPKQQGSWSIKKVLPAIAPDLSYAELDGVQDGGMAIDAYYRAIATTTTNAKKLELQRQLLNYCRLDTYGLVRIWQHFTNRYDMVL